MLTLALNIILRNYNSVKLKFARGDCPKVVGFALTAL